MMMIYFLASPNSQTFEEGVRNYWKTVVRLLDDIPFPLPLPNYWGARTIVPDGSMLMETKDCCI
jgi:hypothetical protein